MSDVPTPDKPEDDEPAEDDQPAIPTPEPEAAPQG